MVISPQGLPRDIRVARSCDLGLDEKAIEAVRKWKFEASKKDGEPVAVQINVEVTFHLYDKPDPKTLIKRANKGDTTAQLQLSNMYFHGEPGLPQDFDLGKEWQQKAANSGQRLAQFLLARRLEDQDPPGAYMWYSLAKEQGYDPAATKLADLISKMSPEQLTEGQARIQEWEKSRP
jgi:TonB family protein